MTLTLGGVGPFGGPVVPSLIRKFSSTPPDTFDTTKSIDCPAVITNGNYLIAIICTTNQSTVSVKPSVEWNLVSSTTSTSNKIFVYSKLADGTEGGTTLTWTFSGNCIATIHCYEFLAPAASFGVDFITASSSPPLRTITGGPADCYFIAVATSLANTVVCNTAPTGYSDLIYTESSTTDSASGAHVAMATAWLFKNAATSDDPGDFGWSGSLTTPAAATISVR